MERQRDFLPDAFSSPQTAGAFWDSHDLAGYRDATHSVQHMSIRIKHRQYLLAIDPAPARQLSKVPRQRGVSNEILGNL
jgi:hypothetical protein